MKCNLPAACVCDEEVDENLTCAFSNQSRDKKNLRIEKRYDLKVKTAGKSENGRNLRAGMDT